MVVLRYESVMSILNELVQVLGTSSSASRLRSRCIEILNTVGDFDPKLRASLGEIQGLIIVESPQKRHESLETSEMLEHTESMRQMIRILTEENRRLSGLVNQSSTSRPEYLCVRLYEVQSDSGERGGPFFITINSNVNSTLSTDGNWFGETLTIPICEYCTMELREESGNILAQSVELGMNELAQCKIIQLGRDWKLKISCILGYTPGRIDFP
jgi:hypothetical protein